MTRRLLHLRPERGYSPVRGIGHRSTEAEHRSQRLTRADDRNEDDAQAFAAATSLLAEGPCVPAVPRRGRGRTLPAVWTGARAGRRPRHRSPLAGHRLAQEAEPLALRGKVVVAACERAAERDRVRAAVLIGSGTHNPRTRRGHAAGARARSRVVLGQEHGSRCSHERCADEQPEEPPVAPGDSSKQTLRFGRHSVRLRRVRARSTGTRRAG